MGWPQRGVYFFFENGEKRRESGSGLRVVRVGTHALTATSKATLWERLAHHRGRVKSGGGDHRGSIFRLLVGSALLKDDTSLVSTTWDVKKPTEGMRRSEHYIEQKVTRTVGAMPFLWLEVNDAGGPKNRRSIIERQSIALLSNFEKQPLDGQSKTWLGRWCADGEARVSKSGLWNQDYVDDKSYDPAFLDVMEDLIERG